jgi:DnaJ-class molecular chaperone
LNGSQKNKEYTALYKRLDVKKNSNRHEIDKAFEKKMEKYPKFVPLKDDEL